MSASPRKGANTQYMMREAYEYTRSKNADTVYLNLADGTIDRFAGLPPEEIGEATRTAIRDLAEADVWLIGSPVYNWSYSSALKNLFEFLDYKGNSGKVAGIALMASSEQSFSDVQVMLSKMMVYYGIHPNPKAVYMTAGMISGGAVADEDARSRLREMVDSTLDLAARVRG